jgi:hypothetical protein
MGTSNYSWVNAKKCYVVGEPYETEDPETGEAITCEWDYDDWYDFRDNFPDFVAEHFGKKREDCTPESDWGQRYKPCYGHYQLASVGLWQEDFFMPYDKTAHEFQIELSFYAVNAYSTNEATIDYDFGVYSVDGQDTNYLAEYNGDVDLLISDVERCFWDWYDWHEDGNATPKKREALHRYLGKVCNAIIEKSESLCARLSNKSLRCVGHFDNGEALYEKA